MGEKIMRSYKPFILIGAVLLLLLTAFLIRNGTVFKVTNIEPGSTASTTAPVIFTFNRTLSSSAVKAFTISPYTAGNIIVNDKVITFTPSDHYKINTEYTVTLANVTAADGSKIKNIVRTFTATFVPIGQLSESEKRQAAAKTDPVDANPFLSNLPYETLHYKVDFSYVKGSTTNYLLTVTLFAILNNPNNPASVADYRAQLVAYRSEALKWISGKGVDTEKVSITYSPNPDN